MTVVMKHYMALYGSPEEQEQAWKALNKAKGFMRTEIAKRIRLRFAPELILEKDTSWEYGAHIDSLLRQIKDSEGNKNE